MAHNPARKKDTRDDKIITLLDILGQRMLDSENERNDVLIKLDELDDKTENSEKAYIALQSKINRSESTFKFLNERQQEIDNKLEEQSEKLERAYAMTEKLEEAMAQQARINRRLDKLVQDKTRMIGKLERIEETVIETQEALHANAMVALEDRPPLAADKKDNAAAPPFWQKAFSAQTTGVAAMIVLAVFCGWGLSQIPYGKIAQSYEEQSPQDVAAVTENESASAPAMSLTDNETMPTPAETLEPAAGGNNDGAENTEELAAHDAATGLPELFAENTDEELRAQMDEDPNALAAQLNDIVTGAGAAPPEDMQDTAEDSIEETKAQTPEAQQPVKKAALPAAGTRQSKANTEAGNLEDRVDNFIAQQSENGDLRDRIQPDEALPEVIKAIEDKAFEGIAEAQHDLAAIYTAGHGGVEADYGKAATWFHEAAVNGVANARYNLGVLYHQGLGVKQDIDTAFDWYRAAALSGHPEAQYNLGIAFIEGIGADYNPSQAALYFENAATAGILEAAYNLGLIHENGLLGSARPEEALRWYKLAADLGSPEGKAALEQLAKIMEVDPENVQAHAVKSPADTTAPRSGTDTKSGNRSTNSQHEPDTQKAAATSAPQGNTSAGELEVGGLRPADIADSTSLNDPEIIESFPPVAEADLIEPEQMQKDQAVTAQIQEQLMRVGLYPGPADGAQGPMTEDAIRSYQSMYELPQDGRASEALLLHMLAGEMDTALPEYGSREE